MEQQTNPGLTTKYRVVMYGGGIEEIDRAQVRDRIRNGEITEQTELATSGDDWRAAGDLPELKRYFSLATPQARIVVGPTNVRVRPPAERMGQRIVQGIVYPIAGLEIVTLLVFAVCAHLPLLGLLSSLAAGVYTLSIVRASADGKTKMPAIVDTSDIPTLIVVSLKTLFITIISLLPVILWGVYAMKEAIFSPHPNLPLLVAGLLIALAISALYYPACLATVAVWDDALAALNPVYILRVARIIGTDYVLVVLVWFAATSFAMLASSPLVSPFARIPLVGGVLASALSLWSLFYVSHLLGYAVFRHSSELGWD